ncbi:MAG: T9SS type A sorting domain-containing protein [Sphingobacteriaceae bacterium]|nr:T9SS type A sorting domain-containing protein [Sphingobacteriaceae bacterium]
MFCFILLIGTLTAQIPTTGLISHWPFSGNANDIVGGNNSTVLNATLTADRFGNPNCAYRFNGTSSYIRMVNAGPTGTVSRSISFWAKTTSTSLTAPFCYGGAPSSFAIQFWYGCSGIGFDNGAGAYIKSNPNVSNGMWHHYVAVLNSTVSTQMSSVAFYMDGNLLSTLGCTIGSTVSAINTTSTFPINIGKVSDNNIRFFNGDLDDFFLYNRALTPAEVLALYNDTPCLMTPPSPGSISGSISICQGASVVYSVAPVAGATSYTWTLPGGWTGASTTNTISVIAGANSGQITVASGNCCGASQPSTQDVNVNPAPVVSITTTQFTICNGNSTTLSANGASTYTWSPFIITSSITVSPSVTSSYTVSGTNTFGCSSSTVTSVVVTNNTLPTILLNGSGISCPGQAVNLAANGASTYTWQPGALNGFFVSVSPTVTTVYTVTGTDANGCYNSATYTQTVSTCAGINQQTANDLQIEIFPNPNNGSFTVNSNNLTEKAQIEIYNSIGQLVLQKKLQANQTFINEKFPTGTYFIKVLDREVIKEIKKIIITSD